MYNYHVTIYRLYTIYIIHFINLVIIHVTDVGILGNAVTYVRTNPSWKPKVKLWFYNCIASIFVFKICVNE
jgi:hypothetical protein